MSPTCISSSTAVLGFKRESFCVGSRSLMFGLYPGARLDARTPVVWHERLDHVVGGDRSDQVSGRVDHGQSGEVVVRHQQRDVGEVGLAVGAPTGPLQTLDLPPPLPPSPS